MRLSDGLCRMQNVSKMSETHGLTGPNISHILLYFNKLHFTQGPG
jgi:hypothetical protein